LPDFFFGAALTATGRWMLFGTSFFDATFLPFGAALRDISAAFFIFFLAKG
jgi:membrane protein YqaA with SNARE-associated domain